MKIVVHKIILFAIIEREIIAACLHETLFAMKERTFDAKQWR